MKPLSQPDKVPNLKLTGAEAVFPQLGQVVRFAGLEWTLREFTAPELALWESIAEAHQLNSKVAEYEAGLMAAKAREAAAKGLGRPASEEERLITNRIELLQAKLAALEAKADLSDTEFWEASELAAEIDKLHERVQALIITETRKFLEAQNKVVQAQDDAYTEMVWRLLQQSGYQDDLLTFRRSLGDDYSPVERVMVVGKAPLPLAALNRTQRRLKGKTTRGKKTR